MLPYRTLGNGLIEICYGGHRVTGTTYDEAARHLFSLL